MGHELTNGHIAEVLLINYFRKNCLSVCKLKEIHNMYAFSNFKNDVYCMSLKRILQFFHFIGSFCHQLEAFWRSYDDVLNIGRRLFKIRKNVIKLITNLLSQKTEESIKVMLKQQLQEQQREQQQQKSAQTSLASTPPGGSTNMGMFSGPFTVVGQHVRYRVVFTFLSSRTK